MVYLSKPARGHSLAAKMAGAMRQFLQPPSPPLIEERDDRESEEQREKRLGDASGRSCETGESQHPSDQREDREGKCPIVHD